jgi:NADPH:quinone reductase-like Zn-dependent oxidoreductase
MRAVRFHEYGGSDVLRLEEIEAPKPGPGEVSVSVRAAALNHLDVDVRAGISRFPIGLPHTLGIELAGEIDAIGEGVTGWKTGDRVNPYLMGTCGTCKYCTTGRSYLCLSAGFISFATGGAFAEKLVVPAAQLIRIPDGVSFEHAAALQVAFGTAWHMLFTRAGLRVGEKVMVNSVGSGIGSAAVQLAHHAGAFVIGNASSDDKLERARELGMDVGINYKRENVVERVMEITGGDGVDVVYEHVGGENFQFGLDSLTKDGRLVTCGGHAGEVVPFDIIPFFRTQRSIIGSFTYSADEVARCFDLCARGLITPLVHSTFPLEEAAAAMDLMESRTAFGKIILIP